MSGGEAKSYLVECYWPGVSQKMLAAAAERTRQAARGLVRQGRELRFLGSLLVPADETVFCLFNGHEADVRAVTAEAGIPLERVLETLWIEGSLPTRKEQ